MVPMSYGSVGGEQYLYLAIQWSVGFADRWTGDEPIWNSAILPLHPCVAVLPACLAISVFSDRAYCSSMDSLVSTSGV